MLDKKDLEQIEGLIIKHIEPLDDIIRGIVKEANKGFVIPLWEELDYFKKKAKANEEAHEELRLATGVIKRMLEEDLRAVMLDMEKLQGRVLKLENKMEAMSPASA